MRQGIVSLIDQVYDDRDDDGKLDVFYPASVENTDRTLPTIVWVHGGGWVSGAKGQVANYARILAGRGYTVVSVDYSLAPRARHPQPARQVNAALGWLTANARRLHVDAAHLFLAGDSGGAQIAAEVANLESDATYAQALGIVPAIRREQLAGVLLYCGAYDMAGVRLDGPMGDFLRTALWSYSGSRDFMHDKPFALGFVVDHVASAFPPAFISAGNGDPLKPQSARLAEVLKARGVVVEVLFFPDDHQPVLPHEYQFNLDTDAGRQALERSLAFVAERSR